MIIKKKVKESKVSNFELQICKITLQEVSDFDS